ncbi:MAG: TRAP transporter small permease [Paracoccaceae bacterium]|nr:TRAP transporter small permease [Paracoccaceae bacterium]
METEHKSNKVVAVLDRVLMWVSLVGGGLGLGSLVVLSVFNVLIMRKALNNPIIGAEDVMVILLIVIVALSIALGARTGAHIEIEVLESSMSERFAKWSLVFVKALGVAILAIMAWQLWHAGGSAARFGETTQLLLIPYGPFYYLLALSIAVYVLVLILDIWQIVLFGKAPKLKVGGELE